ncbi:MAG: multidrug efflux MFS transporter [Clostridia bacterium]|nr:multidrug efflux MFS transporter [Clostridia bacterium]
MQKKHTYSWISSSDIFMIAIIISGGFVTILNQTVLSPALPSIMRDFGIGPSQGQWLTTAFMLVNGIMIPITAYLIDRFTTRKLFIGSVSIFAAGTTLAAVAPNFTVLLIARILQAIGAGIQMPLGSVVMMLIFPKEKRGIAMGIVGIVISFAPAIGPTLAGWVVDNWGWHVIFWTILPLTLLVITFAFFFLKNIGQTHHPHLDWPSVFLSTLAFGSLLYGFSAAATYGWLSLFTIIPLLTGSITLYFYVKRQLALEEPLLNLRVLKTKVFAYSTILTMVINASLLVGAIIMPILLQDVLGYSAFDSGLLMMPGAIVLGIMSPISGTLFDRFGPRMLAISGLLILAVTSAVLGFVTENTTFLFMCILFTIRNFGIAMINMPINTWGLNALDNKYIAHGNAINNTARQIAGSIGTAFLITIMTMVMMNNAQTGKIHSTLMGINAAFGAQALMAGIALIIAILKVHDNSKEGRLMPGGKGNE